MEASAKRQAATDAIARAKAQKEAAFNRAVDRYRRFGLNPQVQAYLSQFSKTEAAAILESIKKAASET
jgi:hypothetical protein